MKKRCIHCQGNYLTLTEEDIDGHTYERVRLRPGARIIPIREKKVLFIREFRKHEKRTSLKLVSGWIDKKDKTILQTAQEELAEEAGCRAPVWKKFHTMNTDNYTVENETHYFLAHNVTEPVDKIENPDHDIVEEIVWLSERDFWKKLDQKEIDWFSDSMVISIAFRSLQE